MDDTSKRYLIHLIKEDEIAKAQELRRQQIARIHAALTECGQKIEECKEAVRGCSERLQQCREGMQECVKGIMGV